MYVVKKFKQSPFDFHEVAQDVLILCDEKTGDPVASIDDNGIFENQTFSKSEVSFMLLSKKTKHLRTGDRVITDIDGHSMEIEGIITGIDEDAENYYDHLFHVNDCKNYHQNSFSDKTYKEPPSTLTVKRKNIRAKPWKSAVIDVSDDNKWKWIEQELNKMIGTADGSTEAKILAFMKNYTNPK